MSVCSLFWLPPQVLAEETSALNIMEKVFYRDDGLDSYSKVEMLLVDKKNNTRGRILEIYAKDYSSLIKTFLEFTEPADIKGTKFLSIEEEKADNTQYLYLPALGRSRRIVSSQKNLAFVNTDFTYEDMQRRRPEKDTHRIIADEALNSRNCVVVESVSNDNTSQYSKRISWVDKESDVVVKIEFYDKKGKKIKEFRVNGLEKKDGIWTVTDMVMDNEKDVHKTYMKLLEVRYNQGLGDDIFTSYSLEK